MKDFKYKHLWGLVLLISLTAFGAVFIWANLSEDRPPQKTIINQAKKIVEEETEVYSREKYSLCQKIGYSCKQEILLSGAERQELNNQAESEILKKYPPEAGWTIH